MTTSEYTEISDLIGRAFEALGGRALNREVVATVRADLPAHLADYLTLAGISKQVGLYFRRRDSSGIPEAPAVDDDGTHVQKELLTLDDLQYLVKRHVRAGQASQAMAATYAAEARTRYGVVIPLAETG